jgi:6-phosphofructokinase 1
MRIGVFCSGGDAPGMNACVRAVVRRAVAEGHEIVGVLRGYQGILNESFFVGNDGKPTMSLRSVSGWSRYGGAFLYSSRCDEFKTEAGQRKAADLLVKNKIDALIPIGGDGTFHGAVALAKFWSGQIIGCPGTIDNDLLGSDYTIGFSTAVQTAVDAVDKIRDTAESHERMFLIEVMGRHCGYIAVHTAIAGGAEVVCIPETCTDIDVIVQHLTTLKQRQKQSIMMIVAEGDERGGAMALAEELNKRGCPYPLRAMVLGHLQRGGSPSPEDRILASQLGEFAVESILEGHTGKMAGLSGTEYVLTPFEETYREHKPIPKSLLRLMQTLAQ